MQLFFFVCSIKCLMKLNLDVQQWMQALNKWEGRWNRGEWNRARIVTHLMYCSGSNAAINAQYILIARCVLTVWHAQMTDTMLRCSWRRSWWTSRRNSSRRRTSWTNSPKAWKTHRKNWNCQRRQPQTWVVGTRPSLTPRQTCQQRLTCETKLISSDQSKDSFFFFFPKKNKPTCFFHFWEALTLLWHLWSSSPFIHSWTDCEPALAVSSLWSRAKCLQHFRGWNIPVQPLLKNEHKDKLYLTHTHTKA